MTRPTPPSRAQQVGNPGHRALRVLSGAGWDLEALPLAPSNLGADGLAAWAIMERCPWIRMSDTAIATMFAEGLDRRAQLRADVSATPYVAGSTGQLRAHPASALLSSLERQLESWARLLLLSPDDRLRVGVAEVKVRSKLEELRDRRDAHGRPSES
jgi:hypothetical protein